MSYIIRMENSNSHSPENMSDSEIEAWVTEFEARDVAQILKRGRGRPALAPDGSCVVTLRFSTGELAAIDAQASIDDTTRSDVIRRAVASFLA